MIKKIFVLSVFIGLLFNYGCGENKVKDSCDLALLNGEIYTVNDSIPWAEAIAVKGDRIYKVGSNEEIEKYIADSTTVIDLNGKFVMPGFIDSHAHLIGIGESLIDVDLRDAKNWDEVIAAVAKAASEMRPGEWIIGRGWHQEKFDPEPEPNVEGYPVHTALSNAVPYNPVMLTHASGHAVFANAKAMELAKVDTITADPPGGRIVRDSTGNPIGVFEENAENIIRNVYERYLSERSREELNASVIKKIKLASDLCLKNGVTTLHDAGETLETIELIKKSVDSNYVKLRLYVMINDTLDKLKGKLKDYKLIGYGENRLTVRAIKQYIDGALGSRGAWLLEPYSDLPDSYGSNVTPLKTLDNYCRLAAENGFQMCIHAIGDRGNRETLNLYEKYSRQYDNFKDMRWRIEHAQHVTPFDVKRIARLNVIAAMQGIHCTSDAPFVIERLGGERAASGAYVWRSMLDRGVIICNGTDAPVESINPIASFYASVTRKNKDGVGFHTKQKMTREEAIKTYTFNGAYAAFEENIKGSLEEGKLADIVVLSNNLIKCSEDDILNTEVLYTIVGGKIVYKK
ncbi:amidohydrolase [Melioribacter sp. Ez-97]|uniref:amidohydrolase n=1 Tax=Melioribacter sp. Ez-97 TaxID=3423434 RepID=UPI003EDA698B